MKKTWTNLALTALITCVGSFAFAHGDNANAKKADSVKKEQMTWGIAGDAKSVTRTITIHMSDSMRFAPDTVTVKQGETIRFVIQNGGTMLHEMVIGTQKELDAHAAMMVKFPGMEHDEPYMAHVAPGKAGQIVWTFNKPGSFDFACLIAGHYQAGMVGKITVAADTSPDGVAPPTGDMATGEVRKVDVENKKITIKHGEIKNLDMPPMTMVFQVRDDALLAKAKAGDKVRFTAEQQGAALVVTAIQPVP